MYIIMGAPGMGYPVGFATTTRMQYYARGLVDAGGQVLVLCPGPSEYPYLGILNTETEGKKDGVSYKYTCGTTIRGRTFLRQKWLVLKGLFSAAGLIMSLNKNKEVDALFLDSSRGVQIFFFWLVAKLCNIKYFYERNEQPFYQADYSIFWRTISFFYTHTLFRLFDGVIVISDYLMEYMRKRMRPGARLIKIPILVDVDRFSSELPPPPFPERYIAFCGSWAEVQHGLLSLMKAYAKVYNEFPDLKFVMIGDSIKKSSIPMYRSYAEQLSISDRMIFPGYLTGNPLLSYLTHATVLILTQPKNRKSEAGFPNKLGEYLATGRPVLATTTTQITSYLKDGVDIFLAPQDDIDAFAERLRFILQHQEEAAVVGQNGRKAAMRYFDYKENGKKIKAFIDDICRSN